MEQVTAKELQAQSVAQITERLASLDRPTLIELAALEAGSASPRTTLQAAIDKQLAALDEGDEGGAEGDDTKAPPAAAPAPAPEKIAVTDYRHRDYAGPLTGEQAAWRVHNIKPTTGVRTK